MKKREPIKRKDNVVYFPGLEKRLTDKGLESLEMKKFNEAIVFLEEARDLDPDHDDSLIGLVLAYFEAGLFEKAKILTNEMLLKGIGDYFQLIDLYLTVLIQLHEYEEIAITIEALLDEKEIPPEKYQHFLSLLQFSRRMAENRQQELKEIEPEEESGGIELNLFHANTLNEQLLLVSRLTDKNIRPFVTEIADYLIADEGHPFLKTMLLTILQEQEIERKMIIRKFNMEETVVPTKLLEVRVQPRMIKVKKLLEEKLESENPGLFENTVGLVEQIFFISYPFELDPESNGAWAGAFHFLAQSYLGIESELSNIAIEYEVSIEEIEQAMAKINAIEKISYSNL